MKKTICIPIAVEIKDRIKKFAIKKNISQNSVVRMAITEFLERNE